MARPYTIGGKQFTLLDLDELTAGEVSDVQRLSGVRGLSALMRSIDDIDVTTAVVYVSMLREDEDVEYEWVRAQPLTAFLVLPDAVVGEGEDPPTLTPEAGGASGSATSQTELSQPTT